MFLFVLIATHHSLFELEAAHRDLPLAPAALGPRALDDPVELRRMLATDPYPAAEFGRLLHTLRQQPLGERTLVAVAGDHNLRTHYRYDLPAEQADVDRVFAYLRVPPAFAPAGTGPDTGAFAGHADLMPTLVSLALLGQRYFATGRDQWQPAAVIGQAPAQFERLYTPAGMLLPLDAPKLHGWAGYAQAAGASGVAGDPASAATARRASAWAALRDWHIRAQLLQQRPRAVGLSGQVADRDCGVAGRTAAE